MITDHKLLVPIFKKDVATLLKRLQRILLHNIGRLYKLGPPLFIADWLSQTQPWENRDEEIPGICITISVIDSFTDIPGCLRVKQIRVAVLEDEHLGLLSEYVLYGWPWMKTEVQKDLQPYWSFRDGIAVIDGIAMKGKGVILPASLQNK